MAKTDLILLHAPSNYDFREHAIMYGPISDVIPSTPIFEMYPIGFVSISAYLERNGFNTRIINIANRMLKDKKFNVEQFISKLSAKAFGIDLHWLPHAHGSLELAKLVKKYHPSTPVIMGGLSATCFHKELITYPQVDFVVRGDSTEEPMLQLMKRLESGAAFDDVPNLSWKDKNGVVHHNPMSWIPQSLDEMPLDYSYPVKSVLKYRDLMSLTPFKNWLNYPITCVITCRGCNYDCVTCGGSRYAYKNSFGREKTAYRSPKLMVKDIISIQRYLNGPVFVIGDIRQPGEDYAEELLWTMNAAKVSGPIVLELFAPAGSDFFQKINKSIPHYNIQWSPDSTEEEVRRAFGKGYSNYEMESTIHNALNNGCKRFDLFFMIGLPKQTYSSVMKDAAYLRSLLRGLKHEKKLLPFISPLAPFVDPGSKVFDNPQKHGYRLLFRTLEEHRQALKNPSWKYILNYETDWMTRDEIVTSTYEAAISFNQLKIEHDLIAPDIAEDVNNRARGAMELMRAIDKIVNKHGLDSQEIMSLKKDAERLSSSSICQKRELHWPAASFLRNAPRIIRAFTTRSESSYGA